MSSRMVITGAAGFIGANACARFREEGWEVVGIDDLSRTGSEENADWLRNHVDVEVRPIDIRDESAIRELIEREIPDAVLHLAGQVAVTTSVDHPLRDFKVNATGTLNLLEGLRSVRPEAHLIFASTNKVYGGLEDLEVREGDIRYDFVDQNQGVDEDQPLAFATPYGCSKGAADQYVLDYARTFDLTTTSLRQSCIYGPRQMGVEDQGWVAWFARAAVKQLPITVFGDGKQVRDLLYIDDLLDLFQVVLERPKATGGQAFNVGGGREFTRSVLEVLGYLEEVVGRDLNISFDDWRPSDQRVYISDTSKLKETVGWRPSTPPRQGIRELVEWIRSAGSLPAVS